MNTPPLLTEIDPTPWSLTLAVNVVPPLVIVPATTIADAPLPAAVVEGYRTLLP